MAEQPAGISLPFSYSALGPFLGQFQPPTGPFDPSGAWEHRYAVCIIIPAQDTGQLNRAGWLRLKGQPADAGTFQLEVELAANMNDKTVYSVSARLTCATNGLSTPRRWDLKTQILDPQRQPVEYTPNTETGEVANGVIRRRGARERTIPEPAAWTCNWSLFDAVQRLPGNDVEPLTFTMLEELELLKPNQRLAYRETVELKFGDRSTRLHCFEQIGTGILPYHYWLDDRRRLLFAVGGLRAFLFDPTAGIGGDAR